jgi:hypothetical protein
VQPLLLDLAFVPCFVGNKNAQNPKALSVTLLSSGFPQDLAPYAFLRRLSGFVGPVPSAALDKSFFNCQAVL